MNTGCPPITLQAEADVVERQFIAPATDRLWLTDHARSIQRPTGSFTSAPSRNACCCGRIVGYSMDSRMPGALAVSALGNAVALRGPAGTGGPFGQGSQSRSYAYVHAGRGAGAARLHGTGGHLPDKAAMESFPSLLQKNIPNRQCWTSYAWQTPPRSRRPTTANADKTGWDASPRSSSRHF